MFWLEGAGRTTFILNSILYAICENQIVKYETIGNNEVKEEKVCTIPAESGNWDFTPNYVRHTMLINGMLEFDGKQCVELEKYVHIGALRTSKTWYTLNNIT